MSRFEQDFENIFKPINKEEWRTYKDMQQGERDCRNGVPHKENQSEAYSLGYNSAILEGVK